MRARHGEHGCHGARRSRRQLCRDVWLSLGVRAADAVELARAGDVLLVGGKNLAKGCDRVDKGLWRSADNGVTWQPVGAPLDFPRHDGCQLAGDRAPGDRRQPARDLAGELRVVLAAGTRVPASAVWIKEPIIAGPTTSNPAHPCWPAE